MLESIIWVMTGRGKKIVFIGVIVLLAFVCVAFFVYPIFFKPKTVDKPILEVSAKNVVPILTSQKESFPARILAYKSTDVTSQINGFIVRQFFKDGDFVKKNDLLYEIDQADKVKIRAPISGYITRSYFTEGGYSSGTLANISSIEKVYADISIPYDFARKIKKTTGLDVTIDFESDGLKKTGKLLFIEKNIDKETDSVVARALFENYDERLMPNMFVVATILFDKKIEILIPQSCVMFLEDGTQFVFLADKNGNVFKRSIVVGKMIGQDYQVLKGLDEGDILILDNLQKLKPDMKVKPIFL